MAELILLRSWQLGAGAVALRHPEQRVVAEAVLATRRMQDAAVPEAFADDWQRIVGMPHQGQRADELRAALAKIDDPAGSGELISSGRASGIVARAETRGFVLDLGGLSAEAAAKLKRAVELASPGARIITTSEAPPPKPFKSATICGSAVI